MSDRICQCDNCRRACTLANDTMICDVGNKNKILYDGHQTTEKYYWCNGKYQQQIGIEGRSIFDDVLNGKVFEDDRKLKKFAEEYKKLDRKIAKGFGK